MNFKNLFGKKEETIATPLSIDNAILDSLKSGSLTTEQLKSLGFNNETDFVSWMNSIAEQSLAKVLPKFRADRTEEGGQSTVQFDKRYGFAVKTVEQHYADMPIENTRTAFELSSQRLRDVATPFYVGKQNGVVKYAAVKVVTPVEKVHVKPKFDSSSIILSGNMI